MEHLREEREQIKQLRNVILFPLSSVGGSLGRAMGSYFMSVKTQKT